MSAPAMKRLLWFVGLWLAGVAALAVVALVLRGIMCWVA
ncbi:DUF2474 family protein [Pseudogulbenkiania subflava]|nr:DUF2474 family protein [Pseudogulbenkiania subflava]